MPEMESARRRWWLACRGGMGVLGGVLACLLSTAPARADNEHFEGSELAHDAPQYFVLRPEGRAVPGETGELRLSESGIELTNGEQLEVTLVPARGSHLVYQVAYGQNPRLPSGATLCPLPLNPLYLDFESLPDSPDIYDMSLYCGSRPVSFSAISPSRRAGVYHYRRVADAVWAHSTTESGYLHGAVVQYCATRHEAAGSNACTSREEAAYAAIMARKVPAPVLRRCAAYVTGLAGHVGYISFTGLLNCARVRDSRALFDYCTTRITGQKREDDTRFLDGNPTQAQGVAVCFNALAARQARE